MIQLQLKSVWRKWIIKTARKFGAYGTLDTEQAIKDARQQAYAAGLEQGRSEAPDCKMCPLFRQAQLSFFERHPGKLSSHHKAMERQKFQTGKLDDPPTEPLVRVKLTKKGGFSNA